MSIATKKATIINANNGVFTSFHAYTRPKRSSRKIDQSATVKIVNLDPTDDPEKVCEAYRQIQIDAQNRRIAKNKARLAKKKRDDEKKEIRKAAEEAERIQRKKEGIAKAIESRSASDKAIKVKERQKEIEDFLLSGKPIDMAVTELNRGHINRAVLNLRTFGNDIVSISSTGSQKKSDSLSISVWSVDNFKRPTKKINDTYSVSADELKSHLARALLQGFVIKASDVRAAETAVKRAFMQLRHDNWPICSIKNSMTDTKVRGWLVPCAANGLEDVKPNW